MRFRSNAQSFQATQNQHEILFCLDAKTSYTWLCVEWICVFLGDELWEKKDAMDPFVLLAAALLWRLLKQTLMRVRWKATLETTILWKSFMASGISCATASSQPPTDKRIKSSVSVSGCYSRVGSDGDCINQIKSPQRC